MRFQKKSLGQHFLQDESIAGKIVDSFFSAVEKTDVAAIVEVGPGMGVLTKYILPKINRQKFYAVEIDSRCVNYLSEKFPEMKNNLMERDFLEINFEKEFPMPSAIIGNFPYNISSQILFKILENKNQIPLMTGMFQKEVAQRITSPPGNKEYGILSVLTQAYYDVEYLFEVGEKCFAPPPKVKSGVISIRRNGTERLDCDEQLFIKVVKAGFNKRRKTLRNCLREMVADKNFLNEKVFDKRAEQLSVEEFVALTQSVQDFKI